MPNLHPSRSEFQWYITDGLAGALRMWPSERVEQFEHHVSDCQRCAEQLTKEAELELTLEAAVRDHHRPRRNNTLWLGALVAAAAFLLVVFAGTGNAVGPDGASPTPLASPADAGVELVAIDSSRL